MRNGGWVVYQIVASMEGAMNSFVVHLAGTDNPHPFKHFARRVDAAAYALWVWCSLAKPTGPIFIPSRKTTLVLRSMRSKLVQPNSSTASRHGCQMPKRWSFNSAPLRMP